VKLPTLTKNSSLFVKKPGFLGFFYMEGEGNVQKKHRKKGHLRTKLSKTPGFLDLFCAKPCK
jgi:hypothetical protein